MNRRFFLGGMFAAPAIVKFDNLMPIFSRGQWALAYNATFDGYDVIMPSGLIKREYEVWPEVYLGTKLFGPWSQQFDCNYTVKGWIKPRDNNYHESVAITNRIAKHRAQYPILTGEKKRAAYAPFLGLTPKSIEQRSSVVALKQDQKQLALQPKLPVDPLEPMILAEANEKQVARWKKEDEYRQQEAAAWLKQWQCENGLAA